MKEVGREGERTRGIDIECRTVERCKSRDVLTDNRNEHTSMCSTKTYPNTPDVFFPLHLFGALIIQVHTNTSGLHVSIHVSMWFISSLFISTYVLLNDVIQAYWKYHWKQRSSSSGSRSEIQPLLTEPQVRITGC